MADCWELSWRTYVTIATTVVFPWLGRLATQKHFSVFLPCIASLVVSLSDCCASVYTPPSFFVTVWPQEQQHLIVQRSLYKKEIKTVSFISPLWSKNSNSLWLQVICLLTLHFKMPASVTSHFILVLNIPACNYTLHVLVLMCRTWRSTKLDKEGEDVEIFVKTEITNSNDKK